MAVIGLVFIVIGALASREDEKLAALLGTAGIRTPLGRSIAYVHLDCEASESQDLEPLLHCDRLITISLHFSGFAGGRVTDEAISRIAAEITKFGEKKNGPMFKLHLSDFNVDELVKLLHQICPDSDPGRVIKSLYIYYYTASGSKERLKKELEKYSSVERVSTPVGGWAVPAYPYSSSRTNSPDSERRGCWNWKCCVM